MNRPTIAATVLAALALAGCATSSRNIGSPASYTPPASASAAAPVGSKMPSASAKASCQVGRFRLSGGYSTGPFHPGYVSATSQNKATVVVNGAAHSVLSRDRSGQPPAAP